MKGLIKMKHLFAVVLIFSTCFLSSWFDQHTALKTMTIAPFMMFVIKNIVLSFLLLVSGALCGTSFIKRERHSYIVTLGFWGTLVLMLFTFLLSRFSTNDVFQPLLFIIANSRLLLYITSFYTGLYLFAKKETSQ